MSRSRRGHLCVRQPQEAEGEETPEGHVLRLVPGTRQIVGLTVLGAQAILDRDGELRVTIPESVKASADDLAPALSRLNAKRLTFGRNEAQVIRPRCCLALAAPDRV